MSVLTVIIHDSTLNKIFYKGLQKSLYIRKEIISFKDLKMQTEKHLELLEDGCKWLRREVT